MTPFDIFFNKYKIIDVNFFDISNGGFLQDLTTDNIVNNMRISVATWFYTLRNIATIILACILIYVGIRMALSTVADEKAKYKKMLFDWICSLILIYVLQYIIIFTLEANNTIVRFLRDVAYTDMEGIIGKMALQASLGIGMGSLVAVVALCMIVFQTLAFFLAYINRMLKVAFLIIISPLISITYSIDKMGDGKAQALDAWLKEFVYTILIQPFHVLLYMAFVNTAMSLLTTTNSWLEAFGNVITGEYNEIINAILVILCLKFVNDGEKIIRKIFNFQDDSSKTSMAAGAAVGLAALNTMKKGAQLGTKAAGFMNKVHGMPTKWAKALGETEKFNKVKEKFDQTGLGKMVNSDKFKNAMTTGKNVVKNSKAAFGDSKLGRGISKAKTLKGNFMNKHGDKVRKLVDMNKRYLPKTLAMMGFAMSYATGSSGIMQAIGVGDAMSKGTGAFFESSESGMTNEAADQAREYLKENDSEYKEVESQLGENAHNMEQVNENLNNINNTINSQARTLKKQPDQTTEDALKAFEAEWADIREKKKSQDEETRRRALAREKALKDEHISLYESLDKRAELQEQKDGLQKENKDLTERMKNIEKRIAEDVSKMELSEMMEVLNHMESNSSKSKIDKTKEEVLKMIQMAMLDEKRMADEQNGEKEVGDKQYELTDQEQADAKALQAHLLTLLDGQVKGTGANYNTRKMVLDLFGKENAAGNSLYNALNDYKNAQRGAQYMEQENNYGQLNGEQERFRQETFRKVTGKRVSITDVMEAQSNADSQYYDTTGANG
ncbi:MAG: hypothetical protein IJW20_01235 [Clostridia bacterium]|nr:hypothetical protein [Clostridia bacterium]